MINRDNMCVGDGGVMKVRLNSCFHVDMSAYSKTGFVLRRFQESIDDCVK